MTIRFKCSECASVLKIKDDLAGTSGRCPKCKTKFVVPHPDGDVPPKKVIALSETGSSDSREERVSEFPDSHHSTPVQKTLSPQPREDHEKRSDLFPLGFDPAETLRLDDSNDDLDALGDDPAQENEDPIAEATQGFLEDAANRHRDDEDLDCPSMMVPHPMLPTKSILASAEFRSDVRKTQATSPLDDKAFKTPSISRSIPEPPAFDPSKFLVSDRPANPVETSPSKFDLPEKRSDFSLQMVSEEESFERPVYRPIHRAEPAAKMERPQTEKIDLATAAKMMKKAIKDNQTEEARQREIDAKAGFDFAQFFREFGLRGLGLIVGGVVGSMGLYYIADRAFSSSLKLPKLGYVRGVVKLDGQPLPGAMVTFAPAETELAGTKRERIRSSVGVADDNGQFRMMYIPSDHIEGVAVGKCRVWVTHVGPRGRNDVPDEWSEGGMTVREVTAGNQKAPFEINMQSNKR